MRMKREVDNASSMASVSSEGSTDALLIEQEEIATLTHNVRHFKESLGKLRRSFNADRPQSLHVATHERLGEVLRILRSVLEKYPALQSSEMLLAAGNLIHNVKCYNYDEKRSEPKEFFDAIDQLALAFSSRVSEFLMGDLDNNVPMSGFVSNKTKSCEHLANASEGTNAEKKADLLSPQEIDTLLVGLEQGVDFALHRAKVWSKFAKDVMIYVEQKTRLDLEYAKNLGRLVNTSSAAINQETSLAFQAIYCTGLENDAERAKTIQTACNHILGEKFIEPLSLRRGIHECTRKRVKERWYQELTYMHDVISRLRKARQDYQHAFNLATLDQCHHEKDSLQKIYEAEAAYQSCVIAANEKHVQLVQVKTEVLQQIREMILESDDAIKTTSVAYFELQHLLTAPWANQFNLLREQSHSYEPGSRYVELVKQLPMPSLHADTQSPFTFEHSLGEQADHSFHGNGDGKQWSVCPTTTTASDTDSISSSHSFKSREPSPSSSPKSSLRKLTHPTTLSCDDPELSPETGHMYCPSRSHPVSRAAETHHFRVLMTPSRCRECDSYVYFYGVDCTQCGLACHKKCLGTLAIQCGHKRLPRKMTTFGIDLGQHLSDTSALVPHIVCKCVHEVDLRGKHSMGIYRVSGVKSKVEKLCQAFENGADLVDLTDINPNVVSNVLKLYLRQLPEPLLTHTLYTEFIQLAKDHPTNCTSMESAIADIKDVVKKLPRHHFLTLSLLMLHLKRIADESEINRMPASNLGIVFGPTLLRTADDSDTLNSLVDTIHQTRAVELMVANAETIFNAEEVERAREFGSKWVKPVHHEHRSFSFRDHGKKTKMVPDKDSCVNPWTEGLGLIHTGKDSTEDESCFMSSTSDPSLALPINQMPKIFKGSLKDYQGLEGVSLVMLGSEAKTSSRESAVKGRSLSEGASITETCDDTLKGSSTEVTATPVSTWSKEVEQVSYTTTQARIAEATECKEIAYSSNKARVVRQAWVTQPCASSDETTGVLQTAVSSVVTYTGAVQCSEQHVTTVLVAGRETVVPVHIEDDMTVQFDPSDCL